MRSLTDGILESMNRHNIAHPKCIEAAFDSSLDVQEPRAGADGGLPEESFRIDLIEILYAVVLAASFGIVLPVTAGTPSYTTGLLLWVSNPWVHGLPIMTMFFAYSLVITSWLEYHRSARKFPIKGDIRLAIDLAILFMYYLMFALLTSFNSVLAISAGVFTLYSVWTVSRLHEYKGDDRKAELHSRVLKASAFASFAWVIWGIGTSFPNSPAYEETILLCLSYANLATYRWVARFK